MNEWTAQCLWSGQGPAFEAKQLLHGMSLRDNALCRGWYSPGADSRREVMLPGTPGLASGSGGLLGWAEVFRGSGARNLGRKVGMLGPQSDLPWPSESGTPPPPQSTRPLSSRPWAWRTLYVDSGDSGVCIPGHSTAGSCLFSDDRWPQSLMVSSSQETRSIYWVHETK